MENAPRGAKRWVTLGVVTALAVGAAVAAWAATSDQPASVEPTNVATSESGDGCAGVEAQYIEVDSQIVEPSSRLCFVVDERTEVRVGAAALNPGDGLVLSVSDASGELLGTATSTDEWDPEVVVVVNPGATIVEVTGVSGPVPPFLVYTATFAPASEDGAADPFEVALPTPADCGADVPWLVKGEPLTTEGDVVRACLEVSGDEFATMGAMSANDDTDLRMSVFRIDATEPALVRTVDDTFGTDPEMSVDFSPGVYAVDVSAWREQPAGEVTLTYSDAGADFRRGTPSAVTADASVEVCDNAPVVSAGDAITVEGTRQYLCMAVAEDARLVLEAATLGEEDLVLEVLGFEDGIPYRLAWTQDNPYATSLGDVDPLLDMVFPAGTWAVSVTTYEGQPATDYDVRLVPAQAASPSR